MRNYRRVADVQFPEFTPRFVNMMPFVMGDHSSLPPDLRCYAPMIDACGVEDAELGRVGYLTVDERVVAGESHRRGGVHTEGWGTVGWGGGNWGGRRGLYVANSVADTCRLYDAEIRDTPRGGAVASEQISGCASELMPEDTVYWMHDRTPHESLPLVGQRQFFRLVTSEVSLWFAAHSTPNPLGVQPAAVVVHGSKFA